MVNPAVSILIPCYNADRWVAQAIESALAQTWTDKEVIVVDDGSTDGSLKKIQKFDSRIRWETGRNRGSNIARNRLLKLARGEWLQYLDADDYLLPDKIYNQMTVLRSRPHTDVVFSPVTMEYQDKVGTRFEVSRIPEPHDPWILLALWYLRQTGGSLWRKRALVDVGGWKVDQPCCQEHELYLRLLMTGKEFQYCEEEGAVYRQFKNGTVSTRDIPQVYEQRLLIEKKAEDFLRKRGELSIDRLRAINDARFEVARMVRVYDKKRAEEIFDTIKRSDPDFVPRGHAARLPYQIAYKTLGFRMTECLAEWKRKLA
jgi:glycosyltransferase involved in cell wall biosynthesis